MPRKREELDPVRLLIVELIDRQNTTLAMVSRELGRNHAYLHQFIHRGTPRRLPEEIRFALADRLGVDQQRLVDFETQRMRSLWQASPQQTGGGHPGTKHPSSFAARLSIARAESEFETPTAFAFAVGIHRLRYADLEDGKEEPTLGELYRIYQVSKKPLDWLIGGGDGQDKGPEGMAPVGPTGPSGPAGGSGSSDVDRALSDGIDAQEPETEPANRKRS